MDSRPSQTTLVRRVRTFADDVRRAQAHGAPSDSAAISPAEPAIEPARPAAPSRPPAPPAAAQPPKRPPAQQASALPLRIAKEVQNLPHVITDDSHLSDSGKLLDIRTESGQRAQEGTIVKDTRKKRWTLQKAIGTSIKDWAEEQKKSIDQMAEKRNPTPKVAPSETRAHIIEAARTNSKIAARDDRSVVIEKLRTFARDAERVTGKKFSMAKPAAEETPRWGSSTQAAPVRTQPAVALLVKQARPTIRPDRPVFPRPNLPLRAEPLKSLEKDVAPTAERTLPESSFAMPETTPAPTPPVADVAPAAQKRPATAPAAPASEESDQALEARRAAIEKLLATARLPNLKPEAEREPQPQAASRDIEFTPPTFTAPQTTPLRTYRDDAISDVEQNQRSVPAIAAAQETKRTAARPPAQPAQAVTRPFVLAGAFMVVIIALGGFGLFWLSDKEGNVSPERVAIPAFIDVDTRTSVSFSTNRAALLAALAEAHKAAGRGVTQIYPTYGAEAAAPTSDVLYVIDPRAPGSFIRSLREAMMIGSLDGDAPFFIFKTERFETAFAGMLDWEPFMSADLTPLFGEPVRGTLDRSARTRAQVRDPFFIDEIVGNLDVRVLYDESGAERIVYAFADEETIVLTTSKDALAKLANRLR